MRKRDISKLELRTSLGLTAVNEGAGYGAAGAQSDEPDSKAYHEGYQKIAFAVLAPILALSAFAGLVISLAG